MTTSPAPHPTTPVPPVTTSTTTYRHPGGGMPTTTDVVTYRHPGLAA